MNAKEAKNLGIPRPRKLTALTFKPQRDRGGMFIQANRWQGKDGRSYDTEAEARETYRDPGVASFDEDHTVGESRGGPKRTHRAEGRNWAGE